MKPSGVPTSPADRIRKLWLLVQGDFHHWVPLFNYLDDYFEKELHPRADLQLDVANGLKARPTFPVTNVNAILQFTATILENCSNKHLYGSHDVSALPSCMQGTNAFRNFVCLSLSLHVSVRQCHRKSVCIKLQDAGQLQVLARLAKAHRGLRGGSLLQS